MHRFSILLLATTATFTLGACSDDSGEGSPSSGGNAGSGNSSGSGGATGGSGGTSTGGTAGASAGGSAGQSTGGSAGAATGGSGSGTSCTSATETLLGTIDEVSDGVVELIDEQGGDKTLYIDASAGGFAQAAQNPYIYLDLAGAKVSVTDPASLTANSWDLALKRDVIRTNSADSGPGSGGAARIMGKSFDSVTAADATAATFDTDDFMDDECNALTDQTGKPLTAFTEWYDYDPSSMHLTPKSIVFVVKAANGTSLYKLQISNYYAAADGGTGAASAFYSIQLAPL